MGHYKSNLRDVEFNYFEVFNRQEVLGQDPYGEVDADIYKLPLATNPRAKMSGLKRGFVKVFCRPNTGLVIGGVVVAPNASELILPLTVAVQNGLTVDDVAQTFSVYPSLAGSVTEAARQLMRQDDLA